ncbi:hypothetical protein D039_4498B, partial [Vibrio parahaemolyticus EKP-028]
VMLCIQPTQLCPI